MSNFGLSNSGKQQKVWEMSRKRVWKLLKSQENRSYEKSKTMWAIYSIKEMPTVGFKICLHVWVELFEEWIEAQNEHTYMGCKILEQIAKKGSWFKN